MHTVKGIAAFVRLKDTHATLVSSTFDHTVIIFILYPPSRACDIKSSKTIKLKQRFSLLCENYVELGEY
jgi:hypothetical protein